MSQPGNPLGGTFNTLSATGSRAASVASVLAWAGLGLLATLFSFWVFGHWLLSPTAFRPVPITAADAISTHALALIRLIEAVSTAVALLSLFHFLVRPWLRDGRPSIEGLLLVGALISYVLDTTVNYHDYLMAWNKHTINFGTWAAFFPGHTGPTEYAEALLWGPPMYLYFGVVLGAIQLGVVDLLHKRGPLTFPLALAVSFAVSFGLDFFAESGIIHLGAYAWPFTVGALTVWPGTAVQFPLYESLMVAIYATGYALLRRSRKEDHHGVSFIERGCGQLPSALHLPVRLLAATGFATLMTLIYFTGFNLISLFADTQVALPQFMMYADPAWSAPAH